MMKTPPDPKYARALTFEQYPAQPPIEGVFHVPLRKHRALEGSFMEWMRIGAGQVEGLPVPFEVRQVSVSHATPGRLNAFHIHPKQIQQELWCVIEGEMLVWLADVRQGSPTFDNRQRRILSGQEPCLLHIPSGVAHGYKAGPAGAMLLYAMNSQFDIKDPNEGRLPWDVFGKELWEDNRG